MKVLLLVLLLVGVGSEVRAERASVVVAKATVGAVKVAAKAVRPAPKAAWRGLKWVAAHI